VSGPPIRSIWDRQRPWAGLWMGGGGWFLHQQAVVNTNYADCSLSGPVTVILIGLISAALAVLGGWLSWTARSRAESEGAPDLGSRRFLGELGTGASALFLVAIVYQLLAGLVVPECWR
jgi:hypothetical protein